MKVMVENTYSNASHQATVFIRGSSSNDHQVIVFLEIFPPSSVVSFRHS
jgi:hypothetical protein